jgi:hypothetical protein
VNFVAITLCVASQQVFIVVSIYFVINSVLDTPSYLLEVSLIRFHKFIVMLIIAHIMPMREFISLLK